MTALESWTLGEVVAERTVTVDEVDLFLFSAACWLPHRIHYDAAFARSEGLDDIPVHGPLQASWLAQLAAEWAVSRGGRLVTTTVRHVRPAYPGEPLRASLAVRDASITDTGRRVALTIRIELPDGSATTVGSATVEIPGAGPR